MPAETESPQIDLEDLPKSLPHPGPDALLRRVLRETPGADNRRLRKTTQTPLMVPERKYPAQMAPTGSRVNQNADATHSREAAR
jgi:hypothetical protein